MKVKMILFLVSVFMMTAYAGPFKSSNYEGNKKLWYREHSYLVQFKKESLKLKKQIRGETLKVLLARKQKENAELMKKLNLTEYELAELMKKGLPERPMHCIDVRKNMEEHIRGLQAELEAVKRQNMQQTNSTRQ